MTIGIRFYWVIALVAFMALASAAATVTSRLASAADNTPVTQDEADDGSETEVPIGTLDDGKHLLQDAGITLTQAIEAARGTASGSVGEMDLEHWDGKLVFNVDIGGQDVEVDAGNGAVLAVHADD